MYDAVDLHGTQAAPAKARAVEQALTQFSSPLVAWLDTLLDKRLAQALAASIVVQLEWRNRAHGLLLSELGAYICDPAHAPAGTRRLANLLRSPMWEANRLSLYLWRRRVLHVWDRGYAGRAWMNLALAFPLRFVARWPKRSHTLSACSGMDPVPARGIAQGPRAWDFYLLGDARRHVQRHTGASWRFPSGSGRTTAARRHCGSSSHDAETVRNPGIC